jgi:hypothetical protein
MSFSLSVIFDRKKFESMVGHCDKDIVTVSVVICLYNLLKSYSEPVKLRHSVKKGQTIYAMK